MNELSYIKMEALHLEVGETVHALCCFCNSDKKKLSITRTPEGILYNCWRAACSGKGFIGSTQNMLFANNWKRDGFNPNPYTKEFTLLTPHMMDMCWQKYRLAGPAMAAQGFKVAEVNLLVMPLYNRNMERFGYTTKHMTNKIHKAHHYVEKQEVMLHYTASASNNDQAVVVEDVISAVRVTQMGKGWRGVALLGTDMNADKVDSLVQSGVKHLRIALDPDALNKAYELAAKWGVFFNTCTTVRLSNDPKDLEPIELIRQLGV